MINKVGPVVLPVFAVPHIVLILLVGAFHHVSFLYTAGALALVWAAEIDLLAFLGNLCCPKRSEASSAAEKVALAATAGVRVRQLLPASAVTINARSIGTVSSLERRNKVLGG